MTAVKASRTVSRMPSVAVNQGVSQNGLPMTSMASARMPASAVLLAWSTSPCMVEQPLILVAGLEYRAHLRFVGFELRGSLGDAQFQRLVQPAQFDLGLLGGGDVVGDADEADVLAGRIPARLGFRAQPAPFAVGILVARFQHERFQRSFARDQIPARCAADPPDAAPCASRTRSRRSNGKPRKSR